jgi:hypothetical protein
LDIPAVDLSLIDGRPQELLLLSMDGLVLEYHMGNTAGIAYTQVSADVAHIHRSVLTWHIYTGQC